MASVADFDVEDHIRGALYGNCIGDAIGLLTEFMVKSEAKRYYGDHAELMFDQKVPDMHRQRWKTGDWTDDSDQMIVIMESILANEGKVSTLDIAARILKWARQGFSELGDYGGMGIGTTTSFVLKHEKYLLNPHAASEEIWVLGGKEVAPNGAVMRTSILGIYQYQDLEKVKENALNVGKITHFDPRCQASCVAACTAIALMLQRAPEYLNKDGSYNADAITKAAYDAAKVVLPTKKSHKLLKEHMFASKLSSLKLDEHGKIGYTYKCLGATFWAFRQNDFRTALQMITMEAGDADTNGAVAGALLGCKLGAKKLPPAWLNGLLHKNWLDKKIEKFLPYVIPNYEPKILPAEEETSAPKKDESALQKGDESTATAEAADATSSPKDGASKEENPSEGSIAKPPESNN